MNHMQRFPVPKAISDFDFQWGCGRLILILISNNLYIKWIVMMTRYLPHLWNPVT